MSALLSPAPHQVWMASGISPSPPPRLLLVQEADLNAALSEAVSEAIATHGGGSTALVLDRAADALSRRDLLRRLTAAYDALAGSPLATPAANITPVWIIATGFGAYLGTLLSQRRTVARMLLRAPTVYPDAGWDLPKSMLDARAARSDARAETAPNDNLAFCAASEFLGEVLILDDVSGTAGPHGVYVDYFHAFSRARRRHLETLGTGLTNSHEPGEMQKTPTQAATSFAERVARWLKQMP